MKNQWNVTKLITATSLGVLLWILELLPAAINSIAPSTTFSGPLSTFLYAVMVIICVLVVRQFGSAMMMFFIYGVLAIPFFLLGTPGFIIKIAIAFGAGLIADVLYFLLKRNELAASLVIPGPMLYYIAIVVIELAKIFGIPGMSQTAKVLYTPAVIIGTLAIGAIGGFVGRLIYSRLKNTAIVIRIQGK
jgi:hypothetical protein